MTSSPRRAPAILVGVCSAIALLCCGWVTPSSAGAATAGAAIAPKAAIALYWAQAGATPSISAATPGLGGGAQAIFGWSQATAPEGIALDPAGGKVYWSEPTMERIRVGGIGGASEGASRTLFEGVEAADIAVDPAAGKIYWTSPSTNEVVVAPLGGEGGGGPKALYTEQSGSQPLGLALDPAAGKIYWTDAGSGEIRVGGLGGEAAAGGGAAAGGTGGGMAGGEGAGSEGAGTGGGEAAVGGEAKTLYVGEQHPSGVAVDAANGEIYWTDGSLGTAAEIRGGGIGGEGAGQHAITLFSDSLGVDPLGIAVDPDAGVVYWTDFGSGAIDSGSTDGDGAESVLTLEGRGPSLLALLSPPVGVAAPAVFGAGLVSEPLSCSEGSWAEDLPESLFYEAPRSYSYKWTYEGATVPGASESVLTPNVAGSYACEVTASNQAGSVTQESGTVAVRAGSPVLEIGGGRVVVRRVIARVRLTCGGGSSCVGTLALVAEQKRLAHVGKGKRRRVVVSTKMVTLGHAPYEVPSGGERTLKLSLTTRAIAMLQGAYAHRLEVMALARSKQGSTRKWLLLALRGKRRGGGRHPSGVKHEVGARHRGGAKNRSGAQHRRGAGHRRGARHRTGARHRRSGHAHHRKGHSHKRHHG